ncbi:MAG TPA: L-rhamnose mutarotase [Microbacteriaceae bacterium]
MASVTRHCQLVGVRPELRDEYLRLHEAVWPGVEATIRGCNIRNYTIFMRGDLLVAYFEYDGDDYAADLRKMAADPITRTWWAHTDPCQAALPDAAADSLWAPATEVWHLT